MRKLFLYFAIMLVMHPIILYGQFVVIKPVNNPFFTILKILDGDTLVVLDSIPSGLSGNVEGFISQQDEIYKYYSGFFYGNGKHFGECFGVEKYSVIDNKLVLLSASSICDYELKTLFKSGLKIEFKENGIEFRLPDVFYGGIILPYNVYSNKKQLDEFLKFLTKIEGENR